MDTYKDIEYQAAGVIFTNNTHIIAGYQEDSETDSETNTFVLSGFGGKKEPSDHNSKYTAIREMLEEIFDIQVNLSNIIKEQTTSNIETLSQLLMDVENDNLIDQNGIKDVTEHINYLIKVNKNMYTYSADNVEQNKIKVNNLINFIMLIPVEKYIYHNSYVNYVYNFTQLEEIIHIIKNHNIKSKYYDEIPTNIFDLITKRKKLDGEIKSLALLPLQTDLLVHKYFIQDIEELVNPTVNSHYSIKVLYR